MNRTHIRSTLVGTLPICVMAAIASIASSSHAGAVYDLAWYTIDCGGGTSSAGNQYEVTGTIGQPDAGVELSGGGMTLAGGFWTGAGHAAPTCPADLNGDDLVNVADMLALLSDWGACRGCAGDLNSDGTVDVLDLLQILSAWGACP